MQIPCLVMDRCSFIIHLARNGDLMPTLGKERRPVKGHFTSRIRLLWVLLLSSWHSTTKDDSYGGVSMTLVVREGLELQLRKYVGPRPSTPRKCGGTPFLRNFVTFLGKSRGLYLEEWEVWVPHSLLGTSLDLYTIV